MEVSNETEDELYDSSWGVFGYDDYQIFMDMFSELSDNLHNPVKSIKNQQAKPDLKDRRFMEDQLNSMFASSKQDFHSDEHEHSFFADHSILLVDELGLVKNTNKQAIEKLNITIGSNLEDYGFESYDHSGIASHLKRFGASKHQDSKFDIIQVLLGELSTPTTLIVFPFNLMNQQRKMYILVVLAQKNNERVLDLIKTKYELSSVENEVGACVASGQSLREISADRSRSYKTVRNQFQRVLEKTGSRSQVAFLRLVNNLEVLVKQRNMLSRPYRSNEFQVLNIPRPNGRQLEVVTCGDPNGRCIISIPDILGHGLTTEMALLLKQRSYFLISISRPGYGKTTPIKASFDTEDVFSNDVSTILDLFEVKTATLLARLGSAQSAYGLLCRIPDRFSNCIISSGLLPRNSIQSREITAKWARALYQTARTSAPLFRQVSITALRIFINSKNPSRWLIRNFNNDADQAFLENNIIADFIRESCRLTTAVYGGESSIQDILNSFGVWENEINTFNKPFTFLHGAKDIITPATAVEDFALHHPCDMNYKELQDAGSLIFFSHFPEIIREIDRQHDGM
jgi:pimeloyl-ACP methyl ester carboxylesterase/DNA-binding CsgD family transcriptional regulator